MLMLTRSPGEEFVMELPDGRQIRVVYAGPDAYNPAEARIGIDAPDDVRIRRTELLSTPDVCHKVHYRDEAAATLAIEAMRAEGVARESDRDVLTPYRCHRGECGRRGDGAWHVGHRPRRRDAG